MSQNKFMHPRNIYKRPPSFKDMAIKYPEFRKFAKPDISGKITLDFKDPEALRALTQTLLQKDFDLIVDIPLTRLIPTLPLRLNYLLWIEDLLEVGGIQRSDYISVKGIDIGTGASCIYPLLAAKQNKWKMTATEVDQESFNIAEKNVNTNNLQNLVSVKLVDGNTLLTDIVQNDEYTFSMCNPPFFSSEEDLDFTLKSRSPCRTPPSNGPSGDLKELVAPGGEVAFVLKMMSESKDISTKVKIFTTMLGVKSSLTLLRLELKKLNVASMVETRFCQGNTTRWGIAWTYCTSFSLQKTYQPPNQKKSNVPMSYVVPQEAVGAESMYTVEVITGKVTDLLSEIKVQYTVKKRTNYMTMLDVIAIENTWSHQRRKRRNAFEPMKNENEERTIQENQLNSQNDKTCVNESQCNVEKYESVPKRVKINVDISGLMTSTKHSDANSHTTVSNHVTPQTVEHEILKYNIVSGDIAAGAKSTKCDAEGLHTGNGKFAVDSKNINDQSKLVPLLEASVFVRSLASEIHIEFLWKGGRGGRETMHQVLQYIKNKMK